MTDKRIHLRYKIFLFIFAVILIVSSIAANTHTNNKAYTQVIPQPLLVFGQLIQQPIQLNNNMQLQPYQISDNTNPYYIDQQQQDLSTKTTTTTRHATSSDTSFTFAVADNNIQIRDELSTLNKIATYYSLGMAGSQCSLNGSTTASCSSPFLITNLISLTSTLVTKKICQPAAAGTPLAKMHSSLHLLNFIEGYEGNAGMLTPSKRLTGDTYGLYNDGANNCTVGIGHLVHNGMCTVKDTKLYKTTFPNGQTHAEARQQLYDDVISIENDVNDNLKVHLTQQQFDTLVDFTFNEGENNLKISKLLKDINAGNCDAATITSDLHKFTRDGALLVRRDDEANLFNNGVYG